MIKIWTKIIVAILAIVVLSLSAYSLKTGEYRLLSYAQLLLGLMLLGLGIIQIQEKRKVTWIFLFLSSGFVYLSIYMFYKLTSRLINTLEVQL
ncbi:DUF3953 domain-containing protein [Anaerobacillus sp. HL2]|nr:DUF3953 domain-containing protein [Anaerobacillus sp. HL2]